MVFEKDVGMEIPAPKDVNTPEEVVQEEETRDVDIQNGSVIETTEIDVVSVEILPITTHVDTATETSSIEKTTTISEAITSTITIKPIVVDINIDSTDESDANVPSIDEPSDEDVVLPLPQDEEEDVVVAIGKATKEMPRIPTPDYDDPVREYPDIPNS